MTDPRHALRRASRFLTSRQDADGGWRDFAVRGVATSWTTAYAGVALTDLADLDHDLPGALASAASFLLRQRESGGGWGYNRRCMADADSTALALLFLAAQGATTRLKDAAVLASFQRADGGFATYRHLPPDHPWSAAHAEVTPTAVRALAMFLPDDHAILRAGRDWLARQAARPDAAAYWWTTPAYYALELARLDLPSRPHRVGRPGEAGVFATSLALERSVLVGENPLALEAQVEALLDRQLADGSWPSAAILRVPGPAAQPGSASSRAAPPNADQRRIFTTATAVSALNAVRRVRAARPHPRPLRTPLPKLQYAGVSSPFFNSLDR